MRTLTPGEVETLFDTAKANYYYPVTYTAVSTGLRQAELLGLRWRDIDLDMLSLSGVYANSKSLREATAAAVSP
jgi:integrase